MSKRLGFVIAAGLALGGCCHDRVGYYVPRSNAVAEISALPKSHYAKQAEARRPSNAVATSRDISQGEDELSKLRPYSKEWHAALDAINGAADEELKRKLVICRGCTPPAPDDQTGSLGPKRAAGGYLSLDEASKSLSLTPGSTSSGGLR